MSQREIARRMGIDETKLSKSMSGVRRFQPAELFAFATLTGVTVNHLLGGADDSGPQANQHTPTANPVPTALPSSEPGISAENGLKRRQIVRAAWTMFAENGFEGVRLADIAVAAKMSAPALHYYFSDKAELFAESIRYSVKLAYDRQLAQVPPERSPTTHLRTLARLQLPDKAFMRHEWSIWMQVWARTPFDERSRKDHAKSYSRWENTVRGVVAEGIASGEFRDQPVAKAALNFTALFDGLGVRVLTGLLKPEQMLAVIDEHIDSELLAPSSAKTKRGTHRKRPPRDKGSKQ